jgi:hypothetical protein
MKRWVKHPINQRLDTPAPVGNFLEELEQLCVKHAMVIEHEDPQGSFIVAPITAVGLEDLVVNIHLSGRFFQS